MDVTAYKPIKSVNEEVSSDDRRYKQYGPNKVQGGLSDERRTKTRTLVVPSPWKLTGICKMSIFRQSAKLVPYGKVQYIYKPYKTN